MMAVDPRHDAGARFSRVESAALIHGDDAVRDSLRMLLDAFGVEARAFATAEAFLGAPPTEADALVLAQRLPGMSGLELLASLRPDRPRWRVVLLALHADPWLRREARRLGVTAMISDPAEEGGLIDLLGLR